MKNEIELLYDKIVSNPQDYVFVLSRFARLIRENVGKFEVVNSDTSLNKKFHFCCLYFEYMSLTMSNEYDFENQLLQMLFTDSNSALILSRCQAIRFTNTITNIEVEWRKCVIKLLNWFTEINTTSSTFLSERSHGIYIDRVGVKVICDLKSMLNQINLSGEFYPFFTEQLIDEDIGVPSSELKRLMQWWSSKNELDFSLNLLGL